MSRGHTYYDVFELNQRATPQQVRTAYLRLMKQHHPDTSTARQAPGFVALINLCYETLSDPAKRAAYDAGLRRSTIAAPAGIKPPSTAPQRRSSRWLAAAVLAGAGCFAGMVALASSESFSFAQTPIFQWAGTVPAEPATLPRMTQRDLIQSQVRLAKTLSPSEALLFSERCFRQAQTEDSGRALQLCIIFDDAFLYWRQTPQWNAILPPYFNDEVVHSRHAGSLLRFEANAEGTLAQLRYEAFRALLDDVDRNPEVQSGDPT